MIVRSRDVTNQMAAPHCGGSYVSGNKNYSTDLNCIIIIVSNGYGFNYNRFLLCLDLTTNIME